jgi:hypothetical protein
VARRIDEKYAFSIMLKAGVRPLEPFTSSSRPWLCKCLKCKYQVSPTYNSVQQGNGACKYCAGNAVHPNEIRKVLKKLKLKPLVEFPGAKKPWKCKCLVCSKVVSPNFSALKSGNSGCQYCARKLVGDKNRTDKDYALKLMNSVGLEPIEPFKNSQYPWKSKCVKCGKLVSPRLSQVKSRKSGCKFCAGRAIDERDAVKFFKSKGLKPIEKFAGNKHPWRSIHLECGREVSPSYQAIHDKGQGVCKYCSRKAVHPDDAARVFLENNLKPLEPYSGDSKKPWKAIHLPCGNEVSPKYNIIQRGESIGCHYCSDQFVDPREAMDFFQSKNFQPLEPYPGSAKPWKSIHLICGSQVKPRYGHIKAGRIGCPVCSGNEPITQERAISFFRSKGLEPLEDFKGPHLPWKSIHKACGRKVAPRWSSIQQGNSGCVYCSGKKVDLADVREICKKNNLKLLSPFEAANKPLNALHKSCGNKVKPTYSALRSGQGPCSYCAKKMVSEKEAQLLLTKNNYKPLEDFPGGSKPWKTIHEKCGSQVSVTATYLRNGGKGCAFCAGTSPITSRQAVKFFKTRGFKPLEPFVNARTPMKSLHLVCGNVVYPTWGSLRNSGGCKYCSTSVVNLLSPAYFYLITNKDLNAHKVGISGYGATVNRLERHKKLGWEVFAVLDLDTGELAYELEEKILDWLRNDLGLNQYLLSEQMPQGGHTETIDATEIDLSSIWEKVLGVSRI